MGRTLVVVMGILVGFLLFGSLAAAQNDYELRRCGRLDPSDPCYRDLAVSRADAQICRLIESVSTRNNCYSKIAENTDDKTLCLNIRKERGTFEDRYECYEEFITGIDDRDFCLDDLKGDEKSMDACLLKIALGEGNVSLCDDLFLEDKRMECIVTIVGSLQDERTCSLIKTKIDMKRCLSQQGSSCDTRDKIEGAVFACEGGIRLERRKSTCRSRVASKEIYLDDGEVQDVNFRGREDAVHLKYGTASLETQVAVFDIEVGGSSREATLQPGMTAEHRFVNVYLVDIIKRGTEEMPQAPRLFLCAYPDPAPTVTSPPPKEEQGPVQEEQEPEPAVEQEQDADEKPAETPDTTPVVWTRPTFFEWLGGIFAWIGGFLKKILI